MQKRQKKLKDLARFAVLLIVLIMLAGIPVAAYTSYVTYIYTFGDQVKVFSDFVASPDAYVPERRVNSADIGGPDFWGEDAGTKKLKGLDQPYDLFVDSEGYIYIADPVNNRVIMLNPDYTGKLIIDNFINAQGVPDSLSEPKGVFATEKEIYIADSAKSRIVVFDKQGKQIKIIPEPAGDVIPEGQVYTPVALAVDKSGRIYVVSSTTNQGIIAMSPEGDFQGFIGAPRAAITPWEIFWRNFQTREQRERNPIFVPTEYNNIAIDEEGFVFVTTSNLEARDIDEALMKKTKDFAPVRRLNPQGADVLRRMGFIGVGGDIYWGGDGAGNPRQQPMIVDVAMGPDGTYSTIDEVRSKVFTYDEDGRLLFIFCDDGQYFGNIQKIQAVAYQGTKMLLLDKTSNNFTVYKRTEYGDVLLSAIANQRNRQYDKSVEDWQEVLKRNNNADLAYIGIGKSQYRDGYYEEAMRSFRFALDTKNYSQSFKMYRQIWIQNNVIVIPIVLIIIIGGIMLFMKKANKVNKRDQIRSGRKLKLSSHLFYGFHIIFHPFDGFWDMKKEKRGSPLAATIYLLLACGVFIYQAFGEGFIRNPFGMYNNFIMQSLSIIIPAALFIIANWCLTTLFDGEGSMKDIYMVTCYSLIPLIIVTFFCTLATHIVTVEELAIIDMVNTVMAIWVGALIFFGIMVVHDYSLGKNVLTFLGTFVGIAFIMFIVVLFSGLLLKMINFVNAIYVEVTYRM